MLKIQQKADRGAVMLTVSGRLDAENVAQLCELLDAIPIDKTVALYVPVKPKPGVTVLEAQEAVTIALREMRRLRPADRNNFDMITQDQILEVFNKLTAVFFLVMIALSSRQV